MELLYNMESRLTSESEDGQKRICYLIITHASFVSEAEYVMDLLKSTGENLVENFKNLSSMNEGGKSLIKLYLDKNRHDFGLPKVPNTPPENCSISAFQITKDSLFEPVFKSFNKHFKTTLEAASTPRRPATIKAPQPMMVTESDSDGEGEGDKEQQGDGEKFQIFYERSEGPENDDIMSILESEGAEVPVKSDKPEPKVFVI